MSTLEDLDDLEREEKKEDKKEKDSKKGGDAEMKDADGAEKEDEEMEEEESLIDPEILNSSTRDVVARRRLIENDTRIMKSEYNRLLHEKQAMQEKIKDNVEKIDNNRWGSYPRSYGPAQELHMLT
jgi:26S proteasome regulatory subunit T5